MYQIDKIQFLQIGVQGENDATNIEIDMTSWVTQFPDAVFHILFKPYNASAPSPMLTTYADGVLTWAVGVGATAVVGVGYTEVRAQDASTGLIKKSRIIPTTVDNSVSGVETTPPASYQDWVTDVLNAGTDAKNSAAAAMAYSQGKQIKFEIGDDEDPDGMAGHLLFYFKDEEDEEWEDYLDLGPVDVYATVVAAGYTGTKAQWIQSIQDAEANGLKAEGYANGKQNGTAVESGTYFHDNAQYYKEQAEAAKTAAQAAQAAAESAAETDLVAWLEQHITNPDSPPLDRTLASSSSAAPADMVGDLKSAISVNKKVLGIDEEYVYGTSIKYPSVTNGTPWNGANTNCVRMTAYSVEPGNKAEMFVSRPVDTGCHYVIGWRLDKTGRNSDQDVTIAYGTPVIIPSDGVSIRFTLGQMDSENNYVPIRATDFKDGEIIIRIITKEFTDKKETEEIVDNLVHESVIVPTLSNGSCQNGGNPNLVCSKNIRFNGAFGFTVKIKKPLKADGDYYMMNITPYKSTGERVGDMSAYIKGNELSFSIEDVQAIVPSASDISAFGINVVEYDSSGNEVTIRKTDFDNYDFIVIYSYNFKTPTINTIITRNKDIRNLVDASCYYGHNGNGSANVNRQFAILVTTDVHGDSERFASAIDYLNGIAPIRAGICLGDMASSNFNSAYQWYIDNVLRSNKTWLTVIGNHDGGNSADSSISATVDQVFARWIEPTLSKIGDTELTKTYYAYRNTTHKVEVIVLNVQDVPDDVDSGTGNYVVSRGALGVFSQAQINWFVSELADIPSDYALVVALHILPNVVEIDSGVWTNPGASNPYSDVTVYDGMISEIINAWITGGILSKNYHKDGGTYANVLPTLTVSADFTNRGTGTFAGYLAGHMHRDFVGHVTDYPGQKYYCFDTTANDNSQNNGSDLPRTKGTKEEDCITVVAVDKSTDTVRLVRIGSNFTTAMTDRRYFVGEYS